MYTHHDSPMGAKGAPRRLTDINLPHWLFQSSYATGEGIYNIISDSQFGFRKGLSTIDAIFVLQSLVNKYLSDKKRIYCCFIDFQKAFDSVDRVKLWHKLFQIGIQGKMLKIIKSLYNNVKCCVKAFLVIIFVMKSVLCKEKRYLRCSFHYVLMIWRCLLYRTTALVLIYRC